jgi:hypothetical protein
MMNNHVERWSDAAAQAGQSFVPDQGILGHLLPSYQAALDWQEVARHHRQLEDSTATVHWQVRRGVVAWLRDLARGWRRHGRVRPEAIAGRVTGIRPRTSLANGLWSS